MPVGVQPHLLGVPPPPQVCGAVQSAPQTTVPPQPLDMDPQFDPTGQVLRVQQLPLVHVCCAVHAAPLLMKWPMPSQTTGCWPMHAVWFGLQSLQRPVAMLQLLHGSGSLTQAVPILLHVCGMLPMQRVDPG